jgi:hypothetical protein
MLIEMVSTVTIGYTILLHVQLYYFYPVLVIVPFLFFAGIVHFVLKAWNKQSEIDRMMFLRKIRERITGKRREEEAYIAKDEVVNIVASTNPFELKNQLVSLNGDESLQSEFALSEQQHSHDQSDNDDHMEEDLGLHQVALHHHHHHHTASHMTRRASVALGIKLSQALKSELDTDVLSDQSLSGHSIIDSEEGRSIDSVEWNLRLDSSLSSSDEEDVAI